jgi:hypothetical protein
MLVDASEAVDVVELPEGVTMNV